MDFRQNPAYPLSLTIVLEPAEGDPVRVEAESSDELEFDRSEPFPRDGQDVGYRGRRWRVTGSDRSNVFLTEQT